MAHQGVLYRLQLKIGKLSFHGQKRLFCTPFPTHTHTLIFAHSKGLIHSVSSCSHMDNFCGGFCFSGRTCPRRKKKKKEAVEYIVAAIYIYIVPPIETISVYMHVDTQTGNHATHQWIVTMCFSIKAQREICVEDSKPDCLAILCRQLRVTFPAGLC